MKILSPAGNFESLVSAVNNGADEVYLGVNEFNARNNIDGFTLDNLTEAVDFAHIFNVKVNLAVNILFSDEELQHAVDLVVKAYNIGVDAFIVQDLGLIKILNETYPEIELHASTQMGLHNLEGVKEVVKYGIRRVVLARETPLSEVKRISENTDVEIEYFIQGALCVSFSGNCYLSSRLFDASGNRGRCKQLCRLPYTLKKDGKFLKSGYLLSAKDFNMIDRLDDLRDAGVDVLKIEGRARRPFYVGAVTREYRKALNGENVSRENIELAFNRTYTEGYFNGNGNVISELQNHIGVSVGKVERVVEGKKFTEIFIKSKRKLSPKSTFKFFSKGKEKAVVTAYDLKEVENGKYRITTTQRGVTVLDDVRIISDAEKEEQLLSIVKRRNVDIAVIAKVGEPIKAIAEVDEKTDIFQGEILLKAQKQPLTEEDLNANFDKSEHFNANIKVSCLESVFITKKALNEFRRTVFNELFKAITEKYRKNLKIVKYNVCSNVNKFTNFQVVYDIGDVFKCKNIIYSPEEYCEKNVKEFVEKCALTGNNAFLDTPNFALKSDVQLLKKIVSLTGVGVVANNYYALNLSSNTVIGAGLNVYNSVASNAFNKPCLCAEGDVAERVEFPHMTLRHCPMKSHLNADCARCPYSDGFSYLTDDGKELKLRRKKLSTCTFYLT